MRDSFTIYEAVIEHCPHRSAKCDVEMNFPGKGGLFISEPPERQKAVCCPSVKYWGQKAILISLLTGVKAWIESGIEGTSCGKFAL